MSDDTFIPPGADAREADIRRRVHAQAEFYRHLMIYAGVVTMLWVINLMQAGLPSAGASLWRYWAIWPTVGWGIGVLVHGVTALSSFGFLSRDWEERKVRELMERADR